ncbi:MAG TPA: site-specific integrase [Azospirillum sp.]|nr:site-specific integrase [Azospirillum sp.]
MARQLRSARLDSRSAREKIPVGTTIHYVDLGADGADLGYRKGKTGGKWILRRYVGDKRYEVETIGLADDKADADGLTVFSFRQAQEKARERHQHLSRKALGITEPAAPYTVKQAVEDYLTFKTANGGKSVKDTRFRADAVIIPLLGDVELGALTPKQIRDWHTKLAKTPPRLRTAAKSSDDKPFKQKFAEFDQNDPEAVRRRRATANRTLTILKAVLNHAWRDGHVSSDEAWRRVQPFREADAARLRYLTVEEAKRLVNACDDKAFRNLVQAALQTGARYSELGALRVSDFNPDAGTVFVRASKSGKARHIVLTDEGQKLFSGLCTGRAPTAHILVRSDGSRWLKSYHIRPMKAAVARAKLGDDVSFHILRHTWASLAVMNGVPLLVVADNLGHADTRMVEKHYGHLTQSYKADAIRAHAPRFGVESSNVVSMESSR